MTSVISVHLSHWPRSVDSFLVKCTTHNDTTTRNAQRASCETIKDKAPPVTESNWKKAKQFQLRSQTCCAHSQGVHGLNQVSLKISNNLPKAKTKHLKHLAICKKAFNLNHQKIQKKSDKFWRILTHQKPHSFETPPPRPGTPGRWSARPRGHPHHDLTTGNVLAKEWKKRKIIWTWEKRHVWKMFQMNWTSHVHGTQLKFRHNDFLPKPSRWGVVKKVSYHLQEKSLSSVPCPILRHSCNSFAFICSSALFAPCRFDLCWPPFSCISHLCPAPNRRKKPAMLVDNIMDTSSNCQKQNRIIQKDSKSKNAKELNIKSDEAITLMLR